MKICILGDTHLGMRGDSKDFHKYISKFYTNQFFPYLKENNINTVIQLGDLFDRRKFVNFNTLYKAREYFFDPFKEMNIDLHVTIGNHDTYFKSTNRVNSPSILLKEYDNISVYESPITVEFDGSGIAMIPWICPENFEETMEFITSTPAQVACGHLEISGFEMYRGTVMEHGYDRKVFDKFDVVMSGHFHHKSSHGNIHYLGTPYEITWSDWNDLRGFHIFDTETRELEFIKNQYKMFSKIYYDDSHGDMDKALSFDPDDVHEKTIKVIVKSKENPYWFDQFISNIEKNDVLDLQIVEDNLHLDLIDDDEIAEDIEDTLTILSKYSEHYKDRVNPQKLNKFLHDIYQEALMVE